MWNIVVPCGVRCKQSRGALPRRTSGLAVERDDVAAQSDQRKHAHHREPAPHGVPRPRRRQPKQAQRTLGLAPASVAGTPACKHLTFLRHGWARARSTPASGAWDSPHGMSHRQVVGGRRGPTRPTICPLPVFSRISSHSSRNRLRFVAPHCSCGSQRS